MALNIISTLCLGLQGLRAVLVGDLAAAWLGDVGDAGAVTDVWLKWTYVATACVELAWIYKAYSLASQVSGKLKYSPIQAVTLLIFPALNLLYGIPVAYALWRSARAPERSLLILVWWGFWIVSFYFSVLWYVSYLMPVRGQILFVGSTVCFLILANRITGYQLAQMAAEPSGLADAAEERPSAPRPAGWSLDGGVEPLATTRIDELAQEHSMTVQQVIPAAPAPVVVIRKPAAPKGD
ncbi:DUF4328 domain-containing protein [Phenylobacterium aquaticum]|uniref:DUF4328 domain-containing protein n=1 Tax=Phenylobacterium aquaticum TaxID=1763816 RepID=UPI001F5DC278|nr:DUF4328 domain-containing protein [Phenylobacterium aquaticum]MCI3133492.1 DUF4328 domain-containing protein [Phenylobacterium aquaticum]